VPTFCCVESPLLCLASLRQRSPPQTLTRIGRLCLWARHLLIVTQFVDGIIDQLQASSPELSQILDVLDNKVYFTRRRVSVEWL
jgi:hypothetical protein